MLLKQASRSREAHSNRRPSPHKRRLGIPQHLPRILDDAVDRQGGKAHARQALEGHALCHDESVVVYQRNGRRLRLRLRL